MQGTLGADVVATLVAPSVLPTSTMGARIEVPVTRAIVSYWRPAAYDPVTGLWTVVLDAPLAGGDYQLVWRTDDPEPPELEVFIPLTMVSASAVAGTFTPPGDLPEWAPSVEDVAGVTPAYTRGAFDADLDDREPEVEYPGGEQLTYTDTTSPTVTHVEGLIQAACDEVQGRVAVAIPTAQFGLAKATAKWHVAAMIAGTKQPANTDEASGEYRSHIANFRNSLDELVLICRMGGTRLA